MCENLQRQKELIAEYNETIAPLGKDLINSLNVPELSKEESDEAIYDLQLRVSQLEDELWQLKMNSPQLSGQSSKP